MVQKLIAILILRDCLQLVHKIKCLPHCWPFAPLNRACIFAFSVRFQFFFVSIKRDNLLLLTSLLWLKCCLWFCFQSHVFLSRQTEFRWNFIWNLKRQLGIHNSVRAGAWSWLLHGVCLNLPLCWISADMNHSLDDLFVYFSSISFGLALHEYKPTKGRYKRPPSVRTISDLDQSRLILFAKNRQHRQCQQLIVTQFWWAACVIINNANIPPLCTLLPCIQTAHLIELLPVRL